MILKEILDVIKNIAFGVASALFIIMFIGATARVSQHSMEKTLHDGDVVWVEKITPTFGKLKRGDIITIYAPEANIVSQNGKRGDTMVKRIIAIEGDYVEIKDYKVYVNGYALKETYTKGNKTTMMMGDSKNNNLVIEKGFVYALGDNRTDSIIDSRMVGPIDLKNVKGRLVFRFWPLDKMGLLVK